MELRRRKPFRERSVGERLPLGLVLAVSIVLVAAPEVDIHRRESPEVRGGKLLWRVLATNALGAITYWAWGRSLRGGVRVVSDSHDRAP
jgi:hypothetical protein